MFLKGNAKFQSMFQAHFIYLDGKDQFRMCLPSIHSSISNISISLMLPSFKLLPSTADGDATVSFTSDHAWLWVHELIVWNLSLYSALCASAMTGWQGRGKGRHSCSLTTLKNLRSPFHYQMCKFSVVPWDAMCLVLNLHVQADNVRPEENISGKKIHPTGTGEFAWI